MASPLSRDELDDLARARVLLESPGFAMRVADLAGAPVEALLRRLPSGANALIGKATGSALDRALGWALETLGDPAARPPSDGLHRALLLASGAAGGALGLAGLLVELPVSTTLLLRSIADHARAQGEDLSRPEARLQCLTVFAYGTRAQADDRAETGYFAVRAALARLVGEAASFVAERGVAGAAAQRSAPALARLVAAVAERLGVNVADKAAAQLVPLLGAAGGAAVNALFLEHYRNTARGHFTVRRLERRHGAEAVREAWNEG
jgi:hypothetical protein